MNIIDQISGDRIDTTDCEVFAYAYSYHAAGATDEMHTPGGVLENHPSFRRCDADELVDMPDHLQCWALIDDGGGRYWFPVEVAECDAMQVTREAK